MSEPFIGEIRMFGFPRIPLGWQACDGSLLQIADNDVLYALLGTAYGGDGQVTFGVPDLRGRLPVHQGVGSGLTPRSLGQAGGQEAIVLKGDQLPAHTHAWLASTTTATTAAPGPEVALGALPSDTQYVTDITGYVAYPLAATTVAPAGGSQPHDNLMPALTVNFCIALNGIYPSRP